ATLYTALMAAFQVLLHRYSGQNEILIGAPAAGRRAPALSALVGYLINPLVIREELYADQPFSELLVQTRDTMLAAFEHQAFPFPLLVERLQPVRDPSRSPLFQVMFVLQKTPRLKKSGLAAFAIGEKGAHVEMGELYMESIALDLRVAQFELTLMAAELDGELALSFQYNVDLFDRATIERMAGHFNNLLKAISTNTHFRIGEAPLIGEQERSQILVEWNDTRTEYNVDLALHELIQQQASRTPDAL